jgi:hypothetical protein
MPGTSTTTQKQDIIQPYLYIHSYSWLKLQVPSATAVGPQLRHTNCQLPSDGSCNMLAAIRTTQWHHTRCMASYTKARRKHGNLLMTSMSKMCCCQHHLQLFSYKSRLMPSLPVAYPYGSCLLCRCSETAPAIPHITPIVPTFTLL